MRVMEMQGLAHSTCWGLENKESNKWKGRGV